MSVLPSAGSSTLDFALLAPIPQVHISDALAICSTGKYVAFGSHKWRLFRQLDEIRRGQPVPVLIYQSHEGIEVKTTFRVTLVGWYEDHTQEITQKRLDERDGHRPASTWQFRAKGDSAEGWPIFWHATGLRMLTEDESRPISDLEAYGTGGWRKDAPPRGPEIIVRPSWI